MTLTCKAAILRQIGLPRPYAASLPLSVEQVQLDPPKATDVMVKVMAAGLCHSDLSAINGRRGRSVPVALGHEGAGIVEDVGTAVTDIRPGDHVVFQFSASCGRCQYCLSGRPQICSAATDAKAGGELLSGGSRIRDMDGNTIRHQTGVSCFAEYAVVNRGSVVVIDRDIPLEKAAIFGCAVMTGVGALINTARLRLGESVAIFGLGGLGLSAVLAARAAGAGRIIAIDLQPDKLARAKALGATDCFTATDPDLTHHVHDLTGGGVDFALDLAGAIPALESAYGMLAPGGKLITAGLSAAGEKFAFDHADLVSTEKSICGCYMGSCVPVRDIPKFLHLFKTGRLPVDQLIDGHINFDQINAGFDRLADGAALRQVLLPHGPIAQVP